MRRALRLFLMLAAALTPRVAKAADRLPDLLQDGYRVVYTAPFLAIEGCEHSKRVIIGSYSFICLTNRYVWHYGKAALLLLERNPGLFEPTAFICVDEERCLAGELETPQDAARQ
jgi:hypothetical protein